MTEKRNRRSRRRRFKEFSFQELSAVGLPAMEGASITVTKNQDRKDNDMSKTTETKEPKLEDVLKEMADLKASHEALIKEKDNEIAEMKKASETKSDEPKEVYKSLAGEVFTDQDDPRMVAMAKRHDETAKELAEAKLVNKAKEFDFIPGEEKTRIALIKSIEALPEEERKSAYEAIKKQNEMVTKSHGVNWEPAKVEDDSESKEKSENITKHIEKFGNTCLGTAFVNEYGGDWVAPNKRV